ncbi:hypothetical protein QEN19_001094 [Hanseniaspora menglaensis]
MLLKSKFLLFAVAFVSAISLVKLSCDHMSLIKANVNLELGTIIETNLCSNEKLQFIFDNLKFNKISADYEKAKTTILTYPYEEKAKVCKNNAEQYLLNFNLKREYIELKRTAIFNYQQFKNFVFLKYQLLLLNNNKWKQIYDDKTVSTIATSDKATVTDIEQLNKVVGEVSITDSVPVSDLDNVPLTKSEEVVSHTSSILFDYDTLHNRVTKKAESMISSIEADLMNLQLLKIKDMRPKYVEKIQDINEYANDRMLVMSNMIREINNCVEINSTYFFNETTMECKYAPITRENFREYFKGTQATLEQKSKALVEIDYQNDLSDFESNLEALKLTYVDLFEDWGDSVLAKLKDILVIENLSFDEEEGDIYKKNLHGEGTETLEKWREFVFLKNDVIDKRDTLMEFEFDMTEIKAFVDDLKKNIGLLAHEGGDRLYIIRSKANLEFQAREKAEREKETVKAEKKVVIEIEN